MCHVHCCQRNGNNNEIKKNQTGKQTELIEWLSILNKKALIKYVIFYEWPIGTKYIKINKSKCTRGKHRTHTQLWAISFELYRIEISNKHVKIVSRSRTRTERKNNKRPHQLRKLRASKHWNCFVFFFHIIFLFIFRYQRQRDRLLYLFFICIIFVSLLLCCCCCWLRNFCQFEFLLQFIYFV